MAPLLASPRSTNRKVYVIGVGMTKFEKPGRRENFDYPEMALEAGTKALQDAGIPYSEVQQAVVGYVYGDSTCGQRAVYELGLTGIPVYNVNNNCSTGSTALMMANQFIEGGLADCVLALGFEKMASGSLKQAFSDRTNPLDKHVATMLNVYELEPSPITAQMFGNAGREHMEKYGTNKEHFAKIAWKNHKHSINNPYAQFQKEYSLDEILGAKQIHEPLTKLQCCPTSDGSAAVVLASEDFVNKYNLRSQAVEILGIEMATDLPSTFEENSCMKLVGYDMTKSACDKLYKKTGINPQDIDVIELHDCFSANELITYEALGLCAAGKAGELIDQGDNTYGGKFVVNPSGGLISKGHPLGATGLAQCSELCWQLRGMADRRQVRNAKLALQHNIGLGGAAVVAAYKLGFPTQGPMLRVANVSSPIENEFQSYPVFQLIKDQLKEDGPSLVKKLQGVFGFVIKDGPGGATGKWTVDAKSGTGEVVYNSDKKADCTITMSDKDFPLLMSGKLNPQQAFMAGKLKVSGKMALAMKLQTLKPKTPSSKL